jgi:hypothetical protein
MPVSLKYILTNWAALVALWAPAYLAMLEKLRLDAAQSQILHWGLLIVGALGVFSALYMSWQATLGRAFGATQGRQRRTRVGAAGF